VGREVVGRTLVEHFVEQIQKTLPNCKFWSWCLLLAKVVVELMVESTSYLEK
jgi:hypothetical protein